ncbi:hypothetical protein HBB16_11345 [Pseudonocardia sp. MCCB 268]|nr:hypothetical protein [Pseudonocardia cytotoxica]
MTLSGVSNESKKQIPAVSISSGHHKAAVAIYPVCLPMRRCCHSVCSRLGNLSNT